MMEINSDGIGGCWRQMVRVKCINTEDIEAKAGKAKWVMNQPGQGWERLA